LHARWGARIIRYNGGEFSKTQVGFTEEDTSGYAEQREQAFDSLFGEPDTVLHETLPFIPHIDVYSYKPGHAGRDFWTLVTSGMSDLMMTLPEGVNREYGRVELIFYCNEPKDSYTELLRTMAHFPHDNKTWLGSGHTMTNGNPPSPIFHESPGLDCFLFIPTIVSPENTFADLVTLAGDPVNLLWLVPITSAERDLKLQKGINAIYDLFDQVRHPHVFTGNRRSYV
jgi:hypothetical protein